MYVVSMISSITPTVRGTGLKFGGLGVDAAAMEEDAEADADEEIAADLPTVAAGIGTPIFAGRIKSITISI